MGTIEFSAAVEGLVDEAAARKIIALAGGVPTGVFGKNGKSFLRKQMRGYNNAARVAPWLVLVDLDQDADCVPPFLEEWVPDPSPFLCFRVVVREVEAWLMADTESLASFLSVPRGKIPSNPEQLPDPKTEMVNLARRSRKKAIREDMTPRQGSGRAVGPAYASRLIEYINTTWRPDKAMESAESLRRAVACLRRTMQNIRDASTPRRAP
ncbi:MAG: hypothetical protein V1816_28270 [Pseudomonadota bacterium]